MPVPVVPGVCRRSGTAWTCVPVWFRQPGTGGDLNILRGWPTTGTYSISQRTSAVLWRSVW